MLSIKKRRFYLIMAFMLATSLSFQSLNISLINEANAGFKWFADENGKFDFCWKKIRLDTKENLTVMPLSLAIEEEFVLVEGKKEGCDEASILFACRASCQEVKGGQVITG